MPTHSILEQIPPSHPFHIFSLKRNRCNIWSIDRIFKCMSSQASNIFQNCHHRWLAHKAMVFLIISSSSSSFALRKSQSLQSHTHNEHDNVAEKVKSRQHHPLAHLIFHRLSKCNRMSMKWIRRHKTARGRKREKKNTLKVSHTVHLSAEGLSEEIKMINWFFAFTTECGMKWGGMFEIKVNLCVRLMNFIEDLMSHRAEFRDLCWWAAKEGCCVYHVEGKETKKAFAVQCDRYISLSLTIPRTHSRFPPFPTQRN